MKDNKRHNNRSDDRKRPGRVFDAEAWKPRTELGVLVKSGKITSIDQILDGKKTLLEHEIVDVLLPNVSTDLLLVGQSKGKFGGGQRRVFRQTQKKTREGNKPKFGCLAIVGNEDGYVGFGSGKSKETVPAREKSIRNAKLNIIKIRRGNGSWQDASTEPNTIPFSVEGKCGSVRIKLIPAPRGTGLCIEKECAKLLKIAGIKDIWSQTRGKTRQKVNLITACFEALKNLSEVRVNSEIAQKLGVVDGSIAAQAKE